MVSLTETEMWHAAMTNDETFDGLFFYAVKTTGIFCRPSCKSKRPKRENVVFFFDSEAAQGQGFRPCKRCRPDVKDSSNPDATLIQLACNLIACQQSFAESFEKVHARLGLSRFHFYRLFKKMTGKTPGAFIEEIRVDQAAEMLMNSSVRIVDVCLAVGFTSQSAFYRAFRKRKGCAPGEYRKQLLQ